MQHDCGHMAVSRATLIRASCIQPPVSWRNGDYTAKWMAVYQD